VELEVNLVQLGLDVGQEEFSTSAGVRGAESAGIDFSVSRGVELDSIRQDLFGIEDDVVEVIVIVFIASVNRRNGNVIELRDEKRNKDLSHLREKLSLEHDLSGLLVNSGEVVKEVLHRNGHVLEIRIILDVGEEESGLLHQIAVLGSELWVVGQNSSLIEQLVHPVSELLLVELLWFV